MAGSGSIPVPTGRIEQHPDGYALVFERGFDFPAGHVWEVLTNPDKVAQWLGPVTPAWQAGREYRLDMGASAATGTVLHMSPESGLQLTWEDALGGASVLDWQVLDTPDGAVLRFRTSGNGADFLAEGAAGWQGILDAFNDVASGREPGRETPERWLGLRDAYAEEFDVSPTMGRLDVDTDPPVIVFERWFNAAAADAGRALDQAAGRLLLGREAIVELSDDGGRARAVVRQPVSGGPDGAAALLAGWHQALDSAGAVLAGTPLDPGSGRLTALRDFYRGPAATS